jgi:hypothetical protein
VLSAATSSDPAETEGQRVNRLARAFTDRVPLSNFLAVQGVVRKAVRIGTYGDEQLAAALIRLAEDGRPVSVDTLRIELDGPPRRRSVSDGRASASAEDYADLADWAKPKDAS